ncbi:MAG: hypothetical protein AVDCRST_MAG45-73 [uncultured Solirubrobacterales bacterium]|uniref:Histidine phosphatase family protein n=1 Tax=uncultured Solirubrobacterales bacterium TaxID=768556 RepID=A0A6J4RR46_9ACTN|nr:MAG: hypothetical protein AVDCRST_MAG45-73 [uncultured Solirubrobacterales bacterium]
MRRLLLVRHAPTPATRAFVFPADEPLDERGREAATALRVGLPSGFEVVCSPAVRCQQTAEAAGLTSLALEPQIIECDFGTWAGRTPEEISTSEAAGMASWMTDPSARPHGGESLTAFGARVGAWLDRQAMQGGSAVAITHGGVVKAAVVHALSAPIEAFWRIDATPLAVTELHAHEGRWTLTRVNAATPAKIGVSA